ncbi:MAG: hypothetical protein ACYTGL_28930, partial [Planctomycetota bacterium]
LSMPASFSTAMMDRRFATCHFSVSLVPLMANALRRWRGRNIGRFPLEVEAGHADILQSSHFLLVLS